VLRFRKRFDQDMDWLRGQDLATFHLYAFATMRQCGACSELAASLCTWLAERGVPVGEAATQFAEVASLAKAVQFKLARLAAGRQVDVGSLLEDMEGHWDAALDIVGDH
jgi:hypothetical protein